MHDCRTFCGSIFSGGKESLQIQLVELTMQSFPPCKHCQQMVVGHFILEFFCHFFCMSVKLSFFELDQTFNIGKIEVNQSKTKQEKKNSLGAKGCYVVKAVCYMVQVQFVLWWKSWRAGPKTSPSSLWQWFLNPWIVDTLLYSTISTRNINLSHLSDAVENRKVSFFGETTQLEQSQHLTVRGVRLHK